MKPLLFATAKLVAMCLVFYYFIKWTGGTFANIFLVFFAIFGSVLLDVAYGIELSPEAGNSAKTKEAVLFVICSFIGSSFILLILFRSRYLLPSFYLWLYFIVGIAALITSMKLINIEFKDSTNTLKKIIYCFTRVLCGVAMGNALFPFAVKILTK